MLSVLLAVPLDVPALLVAFDTRRPLLEALPWLVVACGLPA